jgi:hypothetical protein
MGTHFGRAAIQRFRRKSGARRSQEFSASRRDHSTLGAYWTDTNDKAEAYTIAGKNIGKSTGTVCVQRRSDRR